MLRRAPAAVPDVKVVAEDVTEKTSEPALVTDDVENEGTKPGSRAENESVKKDSVCG